MRFLFDKYKKIKFRIGVLQWRKIEKKKIKTAAFRKLIANVNLLDEEKKQIDDFFIKNLGKKIDYSWHKYYKKISGHFDYRFFPEIYYNADLKHYLNDFSYSVVFENKSVFSNYINGLSLKIKTPNSLLNSISGRLLNYKNQKTTIEDALKYLSKKESIFIKPTVSTYGGEGCVLLKKESLSDLQFEEKIASAIKNSGSDFVIQDVINNQNDIKKLNPSTLNTFRVTTYIIDDNVYVAPLVLRIGRLSANVDNAHSGGMFVAVDENGFITSDAKTTKGESFSKHPDTHVVFKGYQISNVPKLIKSAKQMALCFPRLKLIDWDLTLDEHGDVVVIEANITAGSIWLVQMAHGKAFFGNNTSKILKMIKTKNYS